MDTSKSRGENDGMNVDHVLRTFADCGVESLLIGGMNFPLRHEPVLTYDIDLWVRDTAENRERCDTALRMLDASWGAAERDGRPVAAQPGWLARQDVFYLTSPSGAIDIFRAVKGLPSWEESAARAHAGRTAGGAPYRGLCDEDMLACQRALPPEHRRQSRIEALRRFARRDARQDDRLP
ncbi:MAG: hypothetical protein RLZZ111_668 [Planctomycetota bacterium]|jgi:hypothetical protein